MSETNYQPAPLPWQTNQNPVMSDTGFNIGEPGVAGSVCQLTNTITAIADATATTLFTATIPNNSCSATIEVLIRSGITAASHIYDSTRVVLYLITITRVAGANAVAAVSAAVGAQIATSSGGRTLTSTLAGAAVSGAVGASNTIAFQITNTSSVAGVTETQFFARILNGAGNNAIGAAAPSGVTIA